MSDVVLVYPTPTNEQTETVGPPLSILYLGAFLENQGFSVDYTIECFGKLSERKTPFASSFFNDGIPITWSKKSFAFG